MQGAQILYVVAAVTIFGLFVWVVLVLLKAPKLVPVAPLPAPAPESSPPASRPSQRPSLNPHDEIQDEPQHLDEEATGPHALILVTAVGRTDPGLKRSNNEDAYALLHEQQLFVIADGMGRHAAGEVASKLCVDAIADAFKSGEFGDPLPSLPKRANRLRGAILKANARIFAAAAENEAHYGMGTTVVSALFSPNNQRVYVAHVGDSRCYRLRDGALTQLTTDHTLEAAGIQGRAGILSRAVGVEANVDVDVKIESPAVGDLYLLCSDGLSRMVSADEIKETLVGERDLDVALKILIDKANARGGRDNITAILVRVEPAKPS